MKRKLLFATCSLLMLSFASCEKESSSLNSEVNEEKEIYENIKEGEDEITELIVTSHDNQKASLKSSGSYYIKDIRCLHKTKNEFEESFSLGNSTYYKLNMDMNAGAGGDWIYLYTSYTFDEKEALGTIHSWPFTKAKATYDFGEGYFPIAKDKNGFWVDLNAGAGGYYVYLYATRQTTKPLTGLLARKTSKAVSDRNYTYNGRNYLRMTGDLNDGTPKHNYYVYLYVCHD